MFQTIEVDETIWEFLTHAGGWLITRNGRRMVEGTADQVSIALGLKQFQTLSSASTQVRKPSRVP